MCQFLAWRDRSNAIPASTGEPDQIYQALVKGAEIERHSIAQETIVLLEKALMLSAQGPTMRRMVLEQIANE